MSEADLSAHAAPPDWPGSRELLSALTRLPVPASAVELLEDDLRIVWLNDAAAAAMHEQAGSIAGKKMSELPVLRASLPQMLATFRQAAKSGKPFRFEEKIEHELAPAIYETTAVALEGNRFLLIGQDVTRRTSLEQLLRAGEAKYRAVFSTARDAIALFNIDTLRCIEANDAFVSLYGWPRPELREVTLLQLGETARAQAAVDQVLASGSVHLADGLSKRRDGKSFPAECDAHLIQLGERRVLCLITHDLSAQRGLQEQLLLADRFAAVGTLAAGVAHEVNNPLAYLLANLTFLVERLPELRNAGPLLESALEEMRPALREAITGAQRVKEIVNDLKAFSRPELPGGMAIDVAALLDAVLRLLQNELKRRATLVREIGKLPPVIGHDSQLAQVFLHLINNALEALPERPASENRIRLSAAAVDKQVVIEVEDNGEGIDGELKSRVFDPFFTTRPIGRGSGLGLSVCRGIVTALGGSIALESTIGRGTLVRVTLPSAAAEKSRPISDPGVIAMPVLPRLLVIDDEPLLSDAIRRMMMSEADVTACTTVDSALALLARGDRFDAILCDLHLAGRGGMDFHAELSRTTPQLALKVGFVTGGAVTEEGQAFLRKHAERVLDKPFSRNALRALVKSLMAN